MSLPSPTTAEELLQDAARRNPGPWVAHSQHVAQAARRIAGHHPRLDPERAYILGLLHDLGRATGPNRDRHILDGYEVLCALGHETAARIALTHSFALPGLDTLQGEWDGTPEEWRRLDALVAAAEQTEEDRLIQLCDLLALPEGFCTVQERMIDVALRYGVGGRTPDKWRAQLVLKADFDRACGVNIYQLLPGLCDRLLA
ncbi:HD domain-containing protein [Deinococcus hohokamensis]|uniref:HD domain-containing protein n=1 Tax=Deinococcus hohokamensis TaxID=309883 RepID=A0ABV9ICX1_9DEIO